MGWPEIGLFSSNKDEERRKRKRESYAKNRDENQRIAADRIKRTLADQTSMTRRFGQTSNVKRDLLVEVHNKLYSDEFRIWYEATYGESPAEFLKETVLSFEEYSRLGIEMPQWEWVQARIEYISQRNYWRNPEEKARWADEVADLSPQKRRRVLMRLATPWWADIDAMVDIYRERDRITAETGIQHEVDHIYPIVSKVVCGLHVHFNLRVIPMTENRRKRNRLPETIY